MSDLWWKRRYGAVVLAPGGCPGLAHWFVCMLMLMLIRRYVWAALGGGVVSGCGFLEKRSPLAAAVNLKSSSADKGSFAYKKY